MGQVNIPMKTDVISPDESTCIAGADSNPAKVVLSSASSSKWNWKRLSKSFYFEIDLTAAVWNHGDRY